MIEAVTWECDYSNPIKTSSFSSNGRFETITKYYYIFFIMNKKMEMCIFLYDFEQQIMFDKNDIDFKITACKDDIRQWAKDQLKKYATTERTFPKGKTSLLSYCDDDYSYSYFSNSKPIFKGVNNGSK